MPGAPAGPAHLLGFRLDPSIAYAGNLSKRDLDLDAGRGDAGKIEWIIFMPDLLFSNYLGGKLDHLGITINTHVDRLVRRSMRHITMLGLWNKQRTKTLVVDSKSQIQISGP